MSFKWLLPLTGNGSDFPGTTPVHGVLCFSTSFLDSQRQALSLLRPAPALVTIFTSSGVPGSCSPQAHTRAPDTTKLRHQYLLGVALPSTGTFSSQLWTPCFPGPSRCLEPRKQISKLPPTCRSQEPLVQTHLPPWWPWLPGKRLSKGCRGASITPPTHFTPILPRPR